MSTTLKYNPNALETRAPWIHLVAMPNLFRDSKKCHEDDKSSSDSGSGSGGSVSNDDLDEARQVLKYTESVDRKISELVERGTPPSCFICEPLSGNAGGVEIPKGYLAHVYAAMRKVGGLCISDEVQVGYGRWIVLLCNYT